MSETEKLYRNQTNKVQSCTETDLEEFILVANIFRLFLTGAYQTYIE